MVKQFKKKYRMLLLPILLLIILFLSGCSNKKAINDINDVTSMLTEKVNEVDKIVSPTDIKVVVKKLSEVKKLFASNDQVKRYIDFGKTVFDTINTNTKLNIVGITEDGKFYQTEDGYYIKVEDTTENLQTHTIKCEPAILYTQYKNVKIYEKPDKNSACIDTLTNTNSLVAKIGDVEFARDGFTSMKDETGDHAWSEVAYKKGDSEIHGYVYSEYIAKAESSDKEQTAIYAPTYTEESKQITIAFITEYIPEFDSTNLTDEQLYIAKLQADDIRRNTEAEAKAKAKAESDAALEKVAQRIIAQAKVEEEKNKPKTNSIPERNIRKENVYVSTTNKFGDTFTTQNTEWYDADTGEYLFTEYNTGNGKDEFDAQPNANAWAQSLGFDNYADYCYCAGCAEEGTLYANGVPVTLDEYIYFLQHMPKID